MELSLQTHYLYLEVEKDSLDAHFVKHFVLNYIQKVSILESTITLYSNSMEKKIQSFFTYWVKARVKDLKHSHLLEDLEKMSLPLKIHFKKSTINLNRNTVYLKLLDSDVLRITAPTKDLCHYFHTLFKDALISPFDQNSSLLIDLSSSKSLEDLFNTLQRKEILSKKVLFSYEHEAIHKLFNRKKSYSYSKVSKLSQAYDLLESKPNEPIEVIKKRYKKLIATYHPDRVFAHGEQLIRNYTSKFQSLQNAYSFIKAAKVTL
ncbi:MAG: DnaJ domain-containing protein [Thiovulaceae bacterium]|nr:DnaJ domain-containing protein [Sulfurimonadaceae bacterium]